MRFFLSSRALGSLLAALLLGAASAPAIFAAPPSRPVAQVAVGATLSILALPVEVQGAGGAFAPAADGQSLASGDAVQTGPGGAALLTFLDGSEVQLAAETQVRLDPPATGTAGFRLEELVGTAVHRVGQPRPAPNTGYQTDGPTAISLVRGTTYVVTVHRFVDVATSLYPRLVEGNPNLLLGEALATDEDGNLVQTRTWRDPNTGQPFDTTDNLGPYEIAREALYEDQGNLIRVRAFRDLNSGETTDVFDNLGPEDQRAPGSPLNTCAPADTACVTSTILLPDLDGSVGRVEFRPSAPLASVDLNQACFTAGAVTQAVTQGALLPQACADITQRAANLRDAAGAQATAQQAIQIAREQAIAMGLTVPGLAPGTAALLGPQTVSTVGSPPTPPAGPPSPPPPPPPPPAAPPPVGGPDAPVPAEGQPRSGFPYGVLAADLGNAPLARDAGFRVLATTFSWPRTSPSRGRYLFEEKDQFGKTAPNDLTNILDAASKNGMKPGLRLFGAPDWAGGSLKNVSPSDLEDFVYHVVRYAGSQLAFVEVFNEENLPFEWGGSPDPAAYARLLAGAYRGAKRANPSIPVISAGPSQRTGGLGGTMEDVDWLEGFYQANGQQAADAIGIHAYLGNFDPTTPYSCLPLCFRQVEEYRALMQSHGDSRPMYITEMGTLEQTSVDLGGFNWFKLPPDQRASFLVRALRMANATYPFVMGANVFNLDHAAAGYQNTNPQYWFSLLNPDKSPRQAYSAIRQARSDGTLP